MLRARYSKAILLPSGRCRSKKKGKSQEEDEDVFPDVEPKGSLAWQFLSKEQMKNLHRCENEQELEKQMAEEMQVEDFRYDLGKACLLDYYLSNYHWAKEQQFDQRQISAYMTMIITQLNNLREHRFSKLESFVYMKQCLNGAGISPSVNDDCAYPLYMINNEQAKLIAEFNTSTFLLNYSLYEHVFGNDQDEIIIGKEVVVEHCSNSVQFPTPLEEAVHMESYVDNRTRTEHSGGDEKCVEDEKSEEDKFVEAIVEQVKLKHPQFVDVDELRSMVEKFTKGVIIPNKRALEEKIKQREALFMEKIARENQAKQECP